MTALSLEAQLRVLAACREVKLELLIRNGFRRPMLLLPEATQQQTLQALGMQLPEHLSVDYIASQLSPDHKFATIDVSTQMDGPKHSAQQWQQYWGSPEARGKQLLNVVSLELAGTALEQQVGARGAGPIGVQ
jgi:hypothetical protein